MTFKKILKNKAGFTLIEVIVSLIVAGILGAMLITFMNSGVMQSANPVILAQNGTYLNAIMDKMTADYRYNMSHARATGASRTTGFNNFVANLDTANYYSDGSHSYTVSKQRISFTGDPPRETNDAGSKIMKVTITYRDLKATTIFTE
ncbi:MAG TPA: prepilin-type N-terminal cleavage/methylation domain-containing protein [Candidatus Hydrogenedentes bacterium]|nr:prepilin-type N-terminal cleavage/methylation domain-containing protein [Candidatus Hydrogenedentota bacterium]